MKLYLIRHGEALPSIVDSQRPLSDHGRAQVAYLAHHLQDENAKPLHIYHSGILRAQQTAEIIAKTLHITAVDKISGLLPEDRPDSIFDQINSWTEDMMLVGHLPYLAYLLSRLSDEGNHVQFDTATAVCLERVNTKWLIRAVLNP